MSPATTAFHSAAQTATTVHDAITELVTRKTKRTIPRTFPVTEKLQAAAALREKSAALVKYAHEVLENAKAEFSLRLEAEAREELRLAARSMEQVMMDAMVNKQPAPLPFVTKEELDAVNARFKASLDVGLKLNQMATALEQRVRESEDIISMTKQPLVDEIRALEKTSRELVSALYTARVNRQTLVRKFWAWRRNAQLGDTKVGATFAEEMSRGPPFKSVGIQSDVSLDQRENQIQWLQRLLLMEGSLRRHAGNIRSAVEQLEEVNGLIETCIRCPLCSHHFTEAVQFWPCGHVYCLHCFDALKTGPSVYRCVFCGSMSVEGYVSSILMNEIVARWGFKDSGYSDMMEALRKALAELSMLNSKTLESRLKHLRNEYFRIDKDR
jgi:E3 ubiquitin-protein ligase RNF180